MKNNINDIIFRIFIYQNVIYINFFHIFLLNGKKLLKTHNSL